MTIHNEGVGDTAGSQHSHSSVRYARGTREEERHNGRGRSHTVYCYLGRKGVGEILWGTIYI